MESGILLPAVETTPFSASCVAAMKPSLWSALGAGLGAAAAFGIMETCDKGSWFGFLLGVAWVILWRRLVDPAIEIKLAGRAAARHAESDQRRAHRWLVDIAVAAAIALAILSFEVMVEMFVGFVHKQIADQGMLLFAQTAIGPATTVFTITSAWLVARRCSPQGVAFIGAAAGAAASGPVAIPISIYLHLAAPEKWPLTFVAINTLAIIAYWGLAGFLGGEAFQRGAQPNRLLAVSWRLLALTVVWSYTFVGPIPAFFHVQVSGHEALQTVLLNFLRVFGWLAGLFICPATASTLANLTSYRDASAPPKPAG